MRDGIFSCREGGNLPLRPWCGTLPGHSARGVRNPGANLLVANLPVGWDNPCPCPPCPSGAPPCPGWLHMATCPWDAAKRWSGSPSFMNCMVQHTVSVIMDYSVKLNDLDLLCFHQAGKYNEVWERGVI